jgi:hypothetical protein
MGDSFGCPKVPGRRREGNEPVTRRGFGSGLMGGCTCVSWNPVGRMGAAGAGGSGGSGGEVGRSVGRDPRSLLDRHRHRHRAEWFSAAASSSLRWLRAVAVRVRQVPTSHHPLLGPCHIRAFRLVRRWTRPVSATSPLSLVLAGCLLARASKRAR